MSRADQNAATLRRFYQLFNEPAFRAGHFEALHTILAEDFVDHAPVPGQGPGIDGLAQAFAGFYASFADFGVEVNDLVADDGTAAVRLTFRGTHTGPFLGAPATGRAFEVAGINFIGFDEAGRPRARWGFADWQGILAQLGLVGPDPRETNLERVRATYAAFGRGDLEGILAGMHEDIVWRSRYPAPVPFGGTFEGTDGVRRFLGRVAESIEVLAFEPTTFLADGARVVVLGSERARVRSTGLEYSNAWVHVFELREGRIASFSSSNDTHAVRTAFVPQAA
jgi:steroid delta-isomerase-like uncharacterized protein